EPTGPGATLLYIPGGAHGKARALAPRGVWRIQGCSDAARGTHLADGTADEELLRAAARALPPESAQTVFRAIAQALGADTDKDREAAGGALSGEIHERRRKSQVIRFKQISEDAILGPDAPPAAGDLKLDTTPTRPRAPGGALPRLARKGRAAATSDLVQPLALGQARENLPPPPAHPAVGGERYGELLRDQRTEVMLQKLSEGARSGATSRGSRAGAAERTSDEDALIDFAIILAVVLSRTEGAVKQKLFAIRYAHLDVGHSDPPLHRGRPWTTLAGLKRLQGPSSRRERLVTPRMFPRLKQHPRRGPQSSQRRH
ncbi:unnamed protein product, partial [Prorocentrum cordatum]